VVERGADEAFVEQGLAARHLLHRGSTEIG